MIVGRAFTVNALASDVVPPSDGFRTVTVLAPTVAVAEIETLTFRWLTSVRVTELTVIPLPEKATAEVAQLPDAKFVAVTTITWLVAPWARELGLSEVTPGAAVTVKAPVFVALPSSGLRTVTSRAPVAAPAATDRLTLRWVESDRLTEFTVIPVPENDTELFDQLPDPKFEPVIDDDLVRGTLAT